MSAEPINQMNRVNLYVYKHHMPEICVGYKRLVFELHIYQNLVVFGLVYNSLDNFFFQFWLLKMRTILNFFSEQSCLLFDKTRT